MPSTGHEIVKEVGTNEAQVIVHSLQVIYHHPFILAFFPTPQAEGQSAPLIQGLGGMDPLQAHDFRQFSGQNYSEEADVLRR